MARAARWEPRTRTTVTSRSLRLHRMAAALVAERREDPRAVRVFLARPEPGQQRERDDRRRDVVIDRLLHGPTALARVGDEALQVFEVGSVGLERADGQLEEPRPDH